MYTLRLSTNSQRVFNFIFAIKTRAPRAEAVDPQVAGHLDAEPHARAQVRREHSVEVRGARAHAGPRDR